MANYTTLEAIKAALNIGDSSEDRALTALNVQATAVINEWCDRTFGSNKYIEFYVGSGQPFFALRQRPVTAINNLWVDEEALWGQAPGAFAAATLLVQGVDYALKIDQPDNSSRCGLVYNNDQGFWDAPFNWMPGRISPELFTQYGNIKVDYVAGYNTVPANIQLAANLLIAKMRNLSNYGQLIAGESYEEYAVSFQGEMKRHLISSEVRSLLARYRNLAIA